jgi:hypothetical protein
MQLPQDILEIVRKVVSENGLRGAVVYGSHVWEGLHPGSDLDLVCLSPERGMLHYVTTVGGIEVDLYRASERRLRAAIKRKNKTNDNFVLYACAEGMVAVDDEDGAMQDLVDLARKIWRRGPKAPGTSEQQRLFCAIEKWTLPAAHSVATTGSAESVSLKILRCDHVFFRCIQMYCRVSLLWSAPIWILIRWRNSRYAGLQEICGRYIRAQTLDEKAALVRELAGLAQAALQSLRQSFDSKGKHGTTREFTGVWS